VQVGAKADERGTDCHLPTSGGERPATGEQHTYVGRRRDMILCVNHLFLD